MSITCKIGVHFWDGCKCLKCGKTRDFEHDWSQDCEKCSKCGKTRFISHSWKTDDCNSCSKCLKTRNDGHIWYGRSGSACLKCRRIFQSDGMKTIDGEVYATTKIGNQEWIIDNLGVKKFRNGDPLFSAIIDEEWLKAMNEKIPAWRFGLEGGLIYNWYAVNDPRGLSPEGWHIPNKAEFETLVNIVNKNGSRLLAKSNGFDFGPDQDIAEFSAKLYGYHDSLMFRDTKLYAHFWSNTETDVSKAYGLCISYKGHISIYHGYNKEGGLSVRCLRDKLLSDGV